MNCVGKSLKLIVVKLTCIMDSDVAIVTLFNVKFYWILVIHSKQLPIHQLSNYFAKYNVILIPAVIVRRTITAV